MPSLFASLAAVAGATVDAVFSEGFVLQPRAHAALPSVGSVADVNGRTQPSMARDVISFIGTWVAAGALMNAKGRGAAYSTTQAIAAEKPIIDVAVDALPQRPQDGDRILRNGTGEVFTVAKCLPGDFGRLEIYVTDALPRAELPR